MRYFFHFLAAESRLDDELGSDHCGPIAARAEAVRAAREMIADGLRRHEPLAAGGVIEIIDERGRLVDCVSLAEAAFGVVPETRYRRVFDGTPHGCVLLAPDFTIVDANRAYLQATMSELGAIVRRRLFDAFPDNPGEPDAAGVRNFAASLEAVLRLKTRQAMPVQRHDMRRRDGTWDMRYWKSVNVPILDPSGEVEFILHHAEDVTPAYTGVRSRAG
jgi:PAS domain-containing protein